MPVFNVYAKTNPRLKKSKPFSEGVSAGTAKTPTTMRGASKKELEGMAARHGWQIRPISYEEILKMSSAEFRFHEVWNKEALDRAFTIEQKRTAELPIENVKRMWEGKATPDENEKCRIAGDAFATRTPQFARTMENAQIMVEYMQQNDLDATRVESYVCAYKALVEDGRLTATPAQSADDFLAQHPELIDRRTPPIIAARHQREQNTQAHFASASAATREGSVARLVDYGPQRHGVPEPEKYSFKQKIRSMSASEIAQRCKDDPAFRKSLDELK